MAPDLSVVMTRVPSVRRSASRPAPSPASRLTRTLPCTSFSCATAGRGSSAKSCGEASNASTTAAGIFMSIPLREANCAFHGISPRRRGSTAHSSQRAHREIVEPRRAGQVGRALLDADRLELQQLAAAGRLDIEPEAELPPLARSGETLRAREHGSRDALGHATHGPMHAAARAHAVGAPDPGELVAARLEREILCDQYPHTAHAAVALP